MFFFILVLIVVALAALNHAASRIRFNPARVKYDYDAIVVGGSIAGPTIAKALSDQNRKVLLLERTLFTKPDRIVGELLQPGGVNALKQLHMDECASSIGMPCDGYVVVDEFKHEVELPYSKGLQGYSFHFGDFVQNLRQYVWRNCAANVTMLEATVNEVLVEGTAWQERAYGVEYSINANYKPPSSPFHGTSSQTQTTEETVRRVATAPLIIMCDGGASKFKARFQHYNPAPNYHSNFVGLVVRNVKLPVERHGTVFFGKTGPILSYRLDPNEIRMLIDYNQPTLPSLEKQSEWLIEEVSQYLPADMRSEFIIASKDLNGIRSMPVARYPAAFPSIKGYVGIGDHANQRHPLTGGGMTCAFNDVLHLSKQLATLPKLRSEDATEMANIEDKIQEAIIEYARTRYLHSSCINILSWALYAVFSIPALRNACFDYFLCGGDCVSGPMSLLAGVDSNPLHLLRHYYQVMFHGVFNLLTCSGAYSCRGEESSGFATKCFNAVTFFVNPFRLVNALYILIVSTAVFVPLAFMEFVSLWRFVDPTTFISTLTRKVNVVLYRVFFNGKNRKPVGL
ncbi:putative squalene monooxygenase [Trypanosoma theileri]|uniref:Squalene monooxygenase n=1 Tax=Trypanosoma theileri TaxID=67003 RepID=A0A1X0NLC9_9TRYP|nr:putative squalene monooxygenase [Trypanosoma theileri]ORC84910.1 putative squalene monooxygenase [Trypanosoma theileri]